MGFENMSDAELDREDWRKIVDMGSFVLTYIKTARGRTVWAHAKWSQRFLGMEFLTHAEWAYPGTWGEGDSRMGKFIKKAKELAEKQAEKGGAASDAVLAKKLPAFVEFMCETDDGEGNSRQTATLLVFTEDGMWKVCLNDRESQQTLWASGGSLETALGALEVMLEAPNAPWRAAKPKGQFPKGKK